MLVIKVCVAILLLSSASTSNVQRQKTGRPFPPQRVVQPTRATRQPSISVTITENGVQELRRIFPELLKGVITQLPLHDLGQVMVGNRYADIVNRKFKGVGKDNAIDLYLLPPNGVLIDIQKASVIMEMGVNFLSGTSGTSTAEITNLRGQLEMRLEADRRGQAKVHLSGCDLSMGRVKIVYAATGGKVTIIHPRKIEKQFEENANSVICQELQQSLNSLGNTMNWGLGDEPISSPNSTSPISKAFVTKMLQLLQPGYERVFAAKVDSLFYRSALASNPKFTTSPETIQLSLYGSVCKSQRCAVDIAQKPLPTSASAPRKMANLYISDFLPNTYLRSIYDMGLFNITYNNRNFPGSSNFFRQTCAQSVCLGDLLPSWSKWFPQEKAEVVVNFNGAPILNFKSKMAQLTSTITLAFYSKSKSAPRRLMLIGRIENRLNVFIKATLRGQLTGKVKVDEWNFKAEQNNIKATDGELKQLNDNVKQLILTGFQRFITSPIKVTTPYADVNELELALMDGAMFMAFDFNINAEKFIQTLTLSPQ